VQVKAPKDVTGIDAVLAHRALDLAITNLVVDGDPALQETLADDLPGPRRIRVEVTNVGDIPVLRTAFAYGVPLRILVCPDTTPCYRQEERWVAVSPGETIEESFEWDTLGTVGDFTIRAELCVQRDANPVDNFASVRLSALARDTGIGANPYFVFDPSRPSPGWPECTGVA
jgi:hypothetical protein